MATARHRASKVLEIARDRHVEQALNETPEKLNRDRRLVLLSDPVTMARFTLSGLECAREILFLGKPLSVSRPESTGVAGTSIVSGIRFSGLE